MRASFAAVNKQKALQFDLIYSPQIIPKWTPRFLYDHLHWKTLSGKWEIDPIKKTIFLKNPKIKNVENISIIGSPHWNNIRFNVRFEILTDSIKPPEGGVILYYLFKNIKNYYSFHFCIYKKRIELIKRYNGIWTTIGRQDFNLKINEEYSVRITANDCIHRCQIDGGDAIEVKDTDISEGCVAIGAKYCGAEFSNISANIDSSHRDDK
ncbi:hypothetical protein ACFL0M_01175 [Thermodesulfobacteriota bacterium]